MTAGTPEFSATVALAASVISAMSALVALASVFMSRKNWRDSNRPIVTAYVDEESGAEGITVFNLYLRNSGTRPATSVQLTASISDVQKILADEAEPKRRQHIEDVFTDQSRVAILHQDETLVTSFGLASTNPQQQWLKYGKEIQVKIQYLDLEGRTYKSAVPLKVRPRAGFGGGMWQSVA